MPPAIGPNFLNGFTAKLGFGYVFGVAVFFGTAPVTWWLMRSLSRQHVLLDVSQIDVMKAYRDVKSEVARRKRERKQRYLLSLDGGSAGGLCQIFILYEIANRIKFDLGLDELPRLCDYFDMIGGTGMGGWLAILVGRLGLTVSQAKEEYVKTLKLRQARDSEGLKQFLKEVVHKYTGNSEALMFEPSSATTHCHTFVGATTTGDVAYLIKFRSYEVREGPTFNCPIWQAAYAALAYPDTVAPVKTGDGIIEQICISGEIGWSNPTQEVVKEFETKWPRQKLACLASIGAGHDGPIQIDAGDVIGTLDVAIHRVAMDRERIAQDIAYRFHGRNMYFRLNVEHGLHKDKKKTTLADIETHTRNYLCSPEITKSVNKLISTLLRTTDPPEWLMTTEHFEQTIDAYISDGQKWIDKVKSNATKAPAQEVVRVLETIRTASWEEEEWLTLAKTIHRHCTPRILDHSEETLPSPLRSAMNDYFGELEKIRMRLRSLLKSNPHRVWGLPTHEAFISRSITELDSCDKRIQACLVSDTHKMIFERYQDEGIQRFLKWLSLLEPHLRHNSVRLNRSPGTGRQFLQSAEFLKWCDHFNKEWRVLFAYGRPGAGKTITCSSVIECLREQIEEKLKTVTLLIYCDYADRSSQTGLAMIGFLIKQLVWWAQSIPTAAVDLFRRRSKEQKPMDEEDAKTIFGHVLDQFDTIYICIDALDECEPESREQLLRFLKAVDSTSIRLFLTGRHSVKAEVTGTLSELSPKTMSITAAEEDIRIYLSQKLANDRYPEAMNEDFRNQIVERLVEVSQGLFLPAKLQIQSILEHDTLRDRRLALQNTPADLFDAYATTLKRIKQQAGTRPQRALDVLMWTHFGKRPLKVVELQHALAVKPGDTTFDTEGITSEKSLVECCLGLVVVEAQTSTIRLTHFTLREYFDEHWEDSDMFPSGHSTITATCLSYLRFSHNVPPPSKGVHIYAYFHELKEPPPLLRYIVENVGRHLKMNSDGALAEQCIATLEQEEKFQLLELGLIHHDENNTSLHWAAYFGCSLVAELLLRRNSYIDSNTEPQEKQMPALHVTQKDSEPIVPKRSAVSSANSRSSHKHTPLSLAAVNGHEEVVRLLLDVPGVDVNPTNQDGDTPLLLAAREGYDAVVRLLLGAHGVNVNAQDKIGDTSLSTAALKGYEAVVRLLLGAPGIDVNPRNMHRVTPLVYACRAKHEGVIRLLLDVPEVDVNAKDWHGRTPLSTAAQYGYGTVIQLLLNVPRVDVNESGSDGGTPLSVAARRGREEAVRVLLGAPGVDANASGKDGITPLSFAARNGYEAVVQILINTPKVDINAKDNKGDTPLSFAAQNGQEAVVRLLLNTPGIHTNLANDYGETPLSLAVARGREPIVQLLLGAPGIDTK